VQTTTTATVGQPYISEGKIQLSILVDSTGKQYRAGPPGATYVRFDTYGNGGANPDSAGVTSYAVDLDNLYTTTGGAVQNVACGDKICIKAHYITGGGSDQGCDPFLVGDALRSRVQRRLRAAQPGVLEESPGKLASQRLDAGNRELHEGATREHLRHTVAGNGAIALAHQLIAAQAQHRQRFQRTTVAASITAADTLIGS
jgi:hypothetical protein